MFTFSFGSAFAVNATDVVADRTAAVQKITEKYNAELLKVNNALANAKAGTKYPTTATQAEWNAACDEAFEAVKAQLDIQLSEAYQELGAQEVAASAYSGGIQGYEFASAAPGTADGYVYFKSALDKINVGLIDGASTLGHKTASVTYVTADGPVQVWNGAAFVIATTNPANGIDASKIMYEKALAATKTLIESYDIEKFSKEDKVTVGTTTKTSYEWMVAKKADALARLGAFGAYGVSATTAGDSTPTTFNKAAVEAVYKVNAAGTEGENYTGTFYDGVTGKFPAISALKTTQTSLSDAARIDYAKTQALTAIKQAIKAKRADDLKIQNDIIFAQSIATKPNQKAIDDAKEAIGDINEKYDGMIEIFEARFANADYTVYTAPYGVVVSASYDSDVTGDYAGLVGQAGLGYWSGSTYYPQGILNGGVTYTKVTSVLSEANATSILDKIAALKKQAASLKATIAVDGSTALDIDDALEAAIVDEYMYVGTGALSYAMSDTVVHNHAHALLGYTCAGADITGKVTVDGKKYNRVDDWATTGYSYNNTKAVKAIIKEAKAAIKAAASVEDDDKAFLDAYAKYDAVLTTAEQAALFNYGGTLYKQDVAAEAELAAYIDYKVSLMGDKAPAAGTATAIKSYYGIQTTATGYDYLTEVVDAASLQTAIADVKADVDFLLTKDEMKAKAADLTAKVNGVARAVALTQEADVLALYDEVMDYDDYCAMVGYTCPLAAQEALLKTDIERLEDLQKAELEAMKKALPAITKLTLADADAVEAFYDAQVAYNDNYGVGGDYAGALVAPATYSEATAYDNKIWELQVDAVEAMIAALPVNATAAQVKEAQDALDELGFEGLCDVAPALLTKLSKFTQDAELATIKAVETLKITASSTAAKGSITVKWTVKGDASAVEGYEIWRSTKHSSGYKKMFTTTKTSYKNTKGLKKGTRYYYKVRAIAYDADGNKIKSDWSNKARRIAK